MYSIGPRTREKEKTTKEKERTAKAKAKQKEKEKTAKAKATRLKAREENNALPERDSGDAVIVAKDLAITLAIARPRIGG